MPEKIKHYGFIDFAKALGCLFVIIFHADVEASSRGSAFHSSTMFLGLMGVSWFIIASGFSLGLNKSEMKAGEFYKSRFLKLYPFYWVAYAAVAVALFIIKGKSILPVGFSSTVFSVIGLDGWSHDWRTSHSGSYLVGEWYFGLLIMLYLLFPIIKKCVAKIPVATALGALLLYFIGYKFNANIYEALPFWSEAWIESVPANLLGFVFGIILAKQIENKKFMNWAAGISAVALVLFKAGFLDYPPLSRLAFMALFVLVAYFYERLFKPAAVVSVVAFLAKYSFLAFLLQHQIIDLWLIKHESAIASFSHSHFLVSYAFGMVVLSYLGAIALYPTGVRFGKFLATKLKKGD